MRLVFEVREVMGKDREPHSKIQVMKCNECGSIPNHSLRLPTKILEIKYLMKVNESEENDNAHEPEKDVKSEKEEEGQEVSKDR